MQLRPRTCALFPYTTLFRSIVKHHAAIEFATCRAVPDDVMGDFIEQLAKQRHMIGVDVFHESIVVQREPSMESLASKLFSKSVT